MRRVDPKKRSAYGIHCFESSLLLQFLTEALIISQNTTMIIRVVARSSEKTSIPNWGLKSTWVYHEVSSKSGSSCVLPDEYNFEKSLFTSMANRSSDSGLLAQIQKARRGGIFSPVFLCLASRVIRQILGK